MKQYSNIVPLASHMQAYIKLLTCTAVGYYIPVSYTHLLFLVSLENTVSFRDFIWYGSTVWLVENNIVIYSLVCVSSYIFYYFIVL